MDPLTKKELFMFEKEHKVAIIGPLPGEIGYDASQFRKVEESLKVYGCEILTPLRHPDTMPYAELVSAMSMDVAMGTHVILLDNWESSNGACNLKVMALRQHKPAIWQYVLEAKQKGWKP